MQGYPDGTQVDYYYDAENQIVEMKDFDGGITKFVYDGNGNKTFKEYPNYETAYYFYDECSRIIEMDEYNISGKKLYKTTYSGMRNYGYDILGNLIYVQDPMGQRTKYTYDSMNNLTGVTDAMGRKTTYTYDLEQNLTSVTDASGRTEQLTYDAGSRRTSYTMNGGNSIRYDYDALNDLVEKTYLDENGEVQEVIGNTVSEENSSGVLYGYDLLGQRVSMMDAHGTKHNGKHDKDSEYHFQLVETDREFTYDENGRLVSSREQEENSGLTTYDYTYDAVGNRLSYVKRTQTIKHPNQTDVAESAFYSYNDSNQLVSAKLFDGKKNTTVDYTYDENGNLISEIGKYGTDKVETYYNYTVENRLQAVYDGKELLMVAAYDGKELLMVAAYDGDGNRVFQLNYLWQSYRYDAFGNATFGSPQYDNNMNQQMRSLMGREGQLKSPVTEVR